ncbi:MAG: gliding motility-associated C-terminal domain-containing protein [Bacteroidales bacterium]|nr:gliding motility-associated C-terminal domain-containing protein [Bacteroidales bacterium]
MKRTYLFLEVFIVMFYSLCFTSISAQTTISHNSVFTITENSIFATNQSITNNGILSNNGVIELVGNWENNGLYHELHGVISLIGEDNQILLHDNQKIYQLEIRGGPKQIGEDVTITGNLNLLHGIITPDERVTIIIEEDAEINSASPVSYINGVLYHSGTGNKYFPIGKNGTYFPVELINIQGENPVTGLELFEPNQNPLAGPDIYQVYADRYWKKTILSGKLSNTQISCESHYIELFNNTSNIVFAQAEQAGGIFSSIGGREEAGVLISERSFTENIFAFAEPLHANEIAYVQIMNIITPDNDGINDFLLIKNLEYYPENELFILNLMGQVIYSVKNYDNSWDATIDDKPLPQGNYMCILKLKNHPVVYTQTITIIR